MMALTTFRDRIGYSIVSSLQVVLQLCVTAIIYPFMFRIMADLSIYFVFTYWVSVTSWVEKDLCKLCHSLMPRISKTLSNLYNSEIWFLEAALPVCWRWQGICLCAALTIHLSAFWRTKHPKYATWLCPFHFQHDVLYQTVYAAMCIIRSSPSSVSYKHCHHHYC
jgi:hypothetical protein